MASSPACLYPLLPFQFPIRPPNGYGLGLISDSDELWRADMEDSSHIVRSLTFLRELFEYHPEEKIVGIVTHSEMISALYESLGEVPYSAKNTQIVPIMIESRGKARK
jgi:broad specificity phosphatase PhoE